VAGSDLYRKDALKKLRDPEQLDTALNLSSPRGWLALSILGCVLLAVVAWSFLGRIPFRADGMGILLYKDSSNYDVIATGSGAFSELSVKVGDTVKTGDKIGIIQLPDQTAQIASAQRVLDQLQAQYASLQQSSAADIAERLSNTEQQVATQRSKIASNNEQLIYLRALYGDQQADLEKGYVTRQQVDDTMTAIHAAEQDILDSTNNISSLQTQQVEFVNEQRTNLQDLESQVLAADNNLKDLRVSTELSRDIIAPVDGTVVQIAGKQGAYVEAGDQVAVIEERGGGLHVVGYFPIQEGKKLVVGMSAQVTPTTVERDIYGSINGKVSYVGALPATEAGLMSTLGNEALVTQMMSAGAPIVVYIELDLDPDAASGFAWSSSYGPPGQITSGTTVSAEVNVREALPISLLLPIVQTWVDPTTPEDQ
jgi:HlyD family secretion protein